MDHNSIFIQLSLVIAVGAVVSLIMRLLRQPLIMGYILTGILVGPAAFHFIGDKHTFETFSEIGIALLLFIVGLGLNTNVFKSLGKVALTTALSILLAVGTTGFLAAQLLGFAKGESIILGLALFFSSTIIILKVLTDKKELNRLYGQLAIGVILLDDVVATLALVVVAAIGTSGSLSFLEISWLIAKGVLITLALVVVGTKVLPRLSKLFAGSQELLFLFTVAWGFGVASLFALIGFSMEVGALFAGVSMASLPYATEMSSRLKPLRDFFVILFFITLGSTFSFGGILENLLPALVLSAIVVLGKPLFVMAALGFLGYTKLTSFKAGIHLSQISEFSIILVVFATSIGLVNPHASTLITLVALITIAASTYLMKYDDKLYALWEQRLRLFERKIIREQKRPSLNYPLILFGYQKGGHEFVRTFRELKKRYVVVDYDPEVIEHLEEQGIRHAYGDATDPELLDEVGIDKAKLVVSTVTDKGTNVSLLTTLRHENPHCVFICHADNYDSAAELYNLGATYVMLPHFIGSEQISAFIKRHGLSHQAFDDYRQKHLINLGRAAMSS
jgi:Kef-type K+ transport system membrane component KefB